jgi:hypothetical protein
MNARVAAGVRLRRSRRAGWRSVGWSAMPAWVYSCALAWACGHARRELALHARVRRAAVLRGVAPEPTGRPSDRWPAVRSVASRQIGGQPSDERELPPSAPCVLGGCRALRSARPAASRHTRAVSMRAHAPRCLVIHAEIASVARDPVGGRAARVRRPGETQGGGAGVIVPASLDQISSVPSCVASHGRGGARQRGACGRRYGPGGYSRVSSPEVVTRSGARAPRGGLRGCRGRARS